MATSERWIRAIDDACADPDMARSNHRITTLHYSLSESLAEALGREGGPNFHSWAVWGSRKAGVTIRQEDLDGAIVNAKFTAGIVGAVVGVAAGLSAGRLLLHAPDYLTTPIGAIMGALIGGWAGREIAIWSRAKAAKLMLQGNRIVIKDIGRQSAMFLELLENGAKSEDRETFFSEMRFGPAEQEGQGRLAAAFRYYMAAFDTSDREAKRAAMIEGNCEIVFHEHIRLDPFIRKAMPFIVRRCVTQRLMSYQIGEAVLTVGHDLPGAGGSTAAKDWTQIEERMRYVFSLFRTFHNAPEVLSKPFPDISAK